MPHNFQLSHHLLTGLNSYIFPDQRNILLEFLNAEDSEILQNISNKDPHTVATVKEIQAMPNLNHEDIEKQIEEIDAIEISYMGFDQWKRNGEHTYGPLKDTYPDAYAQWKHRLEKMEVLHPEKELSS